MATDVDVLKGGVALLAFIMAFYGLTARERKTPYITGSVYSAVNVILFVIALNLISRVCRRANFQIGLTISIISEYLFIFSIFFVLYRIWRIYNRHINFRDDRLVKNMACYRYARNIYYKIFPKTRYEHSTIGITPNLVSAIIDSKYFPEDQIKRAVERNSPDEKKKLSLSIVYKTPSWVDVDPVSIALIISFLENDAYVQYTTCSRHPIEFILRLRKAWGKDIKKTWEQIQGNIVVVDAYTPHYGFADTTHREWTQKIKEYYGIEYITSSESYAGIHTSAAKAFNIIKARHGSDIRFPTLVIYEGPYGLVELESVEQYRIFIRHVLPSEKIWGGMLTFLVETTIPAEEFDLLRSYADVVVDKSLEENNKKV